MNCFSCGKVVLSSMFFLIRKISQIIISKDFLSDIPRIKITKEFLTLPLMRGATVSYFRNDCATLFVKHILTELVLFKTYLKFYLISPNP